MNYNEALIKNALLNELALIRGLNAKALTERILLSIHYRKAVEDWLKVRQSVESEQDATDEIKANAISTKIVEDCGIDDRRMSAESFGQVVEAVAPLETITSILAARPTDGTPQSIPTDAWLQAFAEVLVAN